MAIDTLRNRLQQEGTVTFTAHVKPGAPLSVVTGTLADGTLKIALHAPAEDGKANRELMRFLADELQTEMRHVDILSGAATRRKLIRVTRP